MITNIHLSTSRTSANFALPSAAYRFSQMIFATVAARSPVDDPSHTYARIDIVANTVPTPHTIYSVASPYGGSSRVDFNVMSMPNPGVPPVIDYSAPSYTVRITTAVPFDAVIRVSHT